MEKVHQLRKFLLLGICVVADKKYIIYRMQEPEWMKGISNSTICNFFYSFYVVYLIILLISVVTTVYAFMIRKKLGLEGIFVGIYGLILGAIGTTMMLFFYLMCDRSIIEKFINEKKLRGWKSK